MYNIEAGKLNVICCEHESDIIPIRRCIGSVYRRNGFDVSESGGNLLTSASLSGRPTLCLWSGEYEVDYLNIYLKYLINNISEIDTKVLIVQNLDPIFETVRSYGEYYNLFAIGSESYTRHISVDLVGVRFASDLYCPGLNPNFEDKKLYMLLHDEEGSDTSWTPALQPDIDWMDIGEMMHDRLTDQDFMYWDPTDDED